MAMGVVGLQVVERALGRLAGAPATGKVEWRLDTPQAAGEEDMIERLKKQLTLVTKL